MKKRLFVLVTFLLALYIVPSILVPTSDHAVILAQPNMNKDFSTSGYGDESPQSITSFSETLPDDVLFRFDNETYGDYSESFTAVDDWGVFIGATPTSDGDLGSFTAAGDYVYDTYYENSPAESWLGRYIEISYAINTSVNDNVGIVLRSADSYGGSSIQSAVWQHTTTGFSTHKFLVTSSTVIQCIAVIIRCDGAPIAATIDYLISSASDEMGWQHDGSMNASITSADGDDTATTDGDNITLTSDLDGASFEIWPDTTATHASLVTAYYPFLVLNCTSISVGDGWKLEQYDGSAWATLQTSYITASGISRYNMASLDTYVQKLRLNLTQTATIKFDFIKAYSIANYTVQNFYTAVNDYLYVSSSVLYASITSATFDQTWEGLRIDYDPTLSVSTATYNIWNMTSSDFSNALWNHKITTWQGYSSASETRGDFISGTLSDFELLFWTTTNLAALKFIDTRDWHLIVTVIILFSVPFDETALNWLIILLGLLMIPASTLYLVKGGKDGMSSNKAFYFIVAFMLGWGLLLGGIMG